MDQLRGIHHHDRGAWPDLSAVHDRAGNRPEKDHPRRCGDYRHRRRADHRRLHHRHRLFPADRIADGRRALGRALPRRGSGAEQHGDHRQDALRQARTRHAAGPHYARRAGAAGFVRNPVSGGAAEPRRLAVHRHPAVGRPRRRAGRDGIFDQPLYPAAPVPSYRANARTGAGRGAGVVLRRRRARGLPRPVARNGRADRGRRALDLPVCARRHRKDHKPARFFHYAVFRRPRHDHSDSDRRR